MSNALRLYLASNALTRDAGQHWYPNALDICVRVAGLHGHDVPNVVAAMAILSANTGWDQNVKMLRELAARLRYSNPGTFDQIARKAWKALQGDLSMIRGPKTISFARAIAGDGRAVVLDRHMLRLLKHWRQGVSPRQYERYAQQITRAADIVRIPPSVLQATIWIQERNGSDKSNLVGSW